LVTGTGNGSEALTITLPGGTGLNMDVSIDCETAVVSINDELAIPVVEFTNVPIIGESINCGGANIDGFGAAFKANPGRDFRSKH
jgi:hypothetical protein